MDRFGCSGGVGRNREGVCVIYGRVTGDALDTGREGATGWGSGGAIGGSAADPEAGGVSIGMIGSPTAARGNEKDPRQR